MDAGGFAEFGTRFGTQNVSRLQTIVAAGEVCCARLHDVCSGYVRELQRRGGHSLAATSPGFASELNEVPGSEWLVGDADSGYPVNAVASDLAAVVDDDEQRVAVPALAE